MADNFDIDQAAGEADSKKEQARQQQDQQHKQDADQSTQKAEQARQEGARKAKQDQDATAGVFGKVMEDLSKGSSTKADDLLRPDISPDDVRPKGLGG